MVVTIILPKGAVLGVEAFLGTQGHSIEPVTDERINLGRALAHSDCEIQPVHEEKNAP